MTVEKLDERPHKKSGENGCRSNIGPEQNPNHNTKAICDDARNAEGKPVSVREHEGHGIVCRNPQIGGDIKRRGKAQHNKIQRHDRQRSAQRKLR